MTLVFFLTKSSRISKLLAADHFNYPANKKAEPALIIGSILFGIGWGLAGYCLDPAFSNLLSGAPDIWIFVLFLSLGLFIGKKLKR